MSEVTLSATWKPSDSEFGTRLAMVRQQMGWNAKEAALACDLPPQSWRNWEAGRSPQDYATVTRQIAERTGVDLHWLMTGATLHASVSNGRTLRWPLPQPIMCAA